VKILGRFLRWWLGELGALLAGVPGGGSERGRWLWLEFDEQRLRVRLTGPGPRDLGQLPVSAGDGLVAGLRDRLADVEENLREVLGFEMSRHTPFQAEDVHFAHRVLERDPARQRCRVALDVVPKARLAPLLAALREWDLRADASPAAPRESGDDQRVVLAFSPAAFRERSYVRVNILLAAAVLALAALVVWLPVSAQREYRERLSELLVGARADAAQVAALRDELDARREAMALIAGVRTAAPSMVELLEEVTRVLPDGTHLYRLQVARGDVNLHGSSSAASSLIGILEAVPYLEGVRFASPVTRDGATARERFHIVAELRGPGADPATAPAEGG
jgi:general secretion pathway protein L